MSFKVGSYYEEKISLFLCCLLMITSFGTEVAKVYANNYADGSDTAISPRAKQDNTVYGNYTYAYLTLGTAKVVIS